MCLLLFTWYFSFVFFFFKQKTAYEMRISDWSSDVCSSDLTLLLLLHPVHGGIAVMDFADLIRPARIKQDALGRRRLTGINVGHDADVAIHIERMGAGHGARPCRLRFGYQR